MATGVVPGVIGPLSVEDVAPPLPPGVLLVEAARDAGGTARRLARALGAEGCATPRVALDRLARRREHDLAPYRDEVVRCRRELAAARAAASEGPSTATGAAGPDASDVRRAAADVRRAGRALDAARAGVGPRPRLDPEMARAAHDADEAMAEARRRRGEGLPRAGAVLTVANGAACAVVAGRLVTEAFDRVFPLVAAMPLLALAYTARVVAADLLRRRSAAHRRWTALRALDACTMEELEAREAAVRDWARRARRLSAAETRRAEAEAAWRAMVGDAVGVDVAEEVAATLERAARLDARCRRAEAACAAASLALQGAEDTVGSGHPPLVVLDRPPPGGPPGPRQAAADPLAELVERAGGASVIVVRPAANAPERARPQRPERPAAPAAASVAAGVAASSDPGPPVVVVPGVAVVDLRERVLAGLQRLRARQGWSGPPSGSVTSGT